MDPNAPRFDAEIRVFRREELPDFFPRPVFRNSITMDLKCRIPKGNGLIESNGGEYARKCFRFAPLSRPDALDSDKRKFEQELGILSRAQHPHVIKLVYAYIYVPVEDKSSSVIPDDEDEPDPPIPHAAIIMELAKNFGDTLQGLRNDDQMLPTFFKWFSCLATTLDHIHGVGIRHRDIKPDNILVGKDNEVVLADFGISNMILGKTLSTTSQGVPRDRTVRYCAPEVEGGSSRARSADIFALGVVFLEMLAMSRPLGCSELDQAFNGEIKRKRDGKKDGTGDNTRDDRGDGKGEQSYAKALRSVHELMSEWMGNPKGKVWKNRRWEWVERLSMCQDMMNEDPYRRPFAPDIASQVSKIEKKKPSQPCKCSKPPDEPGARLIYICKNGLTSDLHLLDHLKCLNHTVGAVQQASARGHLQILKVLLDNDFDVNLRDYGGQTALHCAAAFGKHEVVEYLLSRPNIKPALEDHKSRTALHCAAGNGNLEVVKMLLKNRQVGLDANTGDEHKRTALHFAATRGHKEVIGELLASKATKDADVDVDAKDINGITALHLAAGYGSVQAVSSLLKRGASADILVDQEGANQERSVLHFAIYGIQKLDENEDRGQYEEVIRLLLPKTKMHICSRVACAGAATRTCSGGHSSRKQMVCDFVAYQPIEPKAIELNDFIQLARRRFSTLDMKRIAVLLEHIYPHWHENGYKVERTFTVLNLSGVPFLQCAKVVDNFVQKGITDYQLPLGKVYISDILRTPGSHARFLREQNKVLSDTICLKEEKQHTSLKHDDWSKHWGSKVETSAMYEDRVFRVAAEGSSPLVVKLIRRREMSEQMLTSSELSVLKRVHYDHIVRLVGSFTTPGLFGIVMSPLARCNLEKFLAGIHEDDALGSSDEKMRFLANCFGCLGKTTRYLHFDAHITHYDIKPNNILVDERHGNGLQVLLTDFGISNDWDRSLQTTIPTPTGMTYMYCAPEIANPSDWKKINSDADIWSLGCVFFEMATVLKGYKIADLRRYFTEHGTCSPNYFANLRARKDWAEWLLEPNGYAGSAKFEWIQDMLKARPSATMLCDMINKSSRETNLPLFGACCKEVSIQTNESVQIRPSGATSGDMAIQEQTGLAAVAWDGPEEHRIYFQKDDGSIIQATRERRDRGWLKQLDVVAEHAKLQSPIAATTWEGRTGLRRPTIRVYFVDDVDMIRERAWDPLEGWRDGPLCRGEFRVSPSSALAVTSWDNGRILLCYQTIDGTLGMLQGWAMMSQWRACESLPLDALPRPASNTSLALVNFPMGDHRGIRLYYQVNDSVIREVCWDGVKDVSWDTPDHRYELFWGNYYVKTSGDAVVSAIAFVHQQRLEMRVYIADVKGLLETRYTGEWVQPEWLPIGKGTRQFAVAHWRGYISQYYVEEGKLEEYSR